MSKRNSSISNSKGIWHGWSGTVGKLAIVLLAIFLLVFAVISPQYGRSYNASMVDKTDRLVSLPGKKIVLIGNSNTAFGIRSSLIEEAFGMDVVNLGLHGGLGNEFEENLSRLNIREGDVYVLLYTDYSEEGDRNLDPLLLWITIENHFLLWRCVPRGQWLPLFKAAPAYVKKCVFARSAKFRGLGDKACGVWGCFDRDVFNEYGDNIYAKDHPDYADFGDGFTNKIPEISPRITARLNRLNETFLRKGARLFAAGYPIASRDGNEDVASFASFRQTLQGYLDFPVISDFTDYLYPYTNFYNSVLHLNETGAVTRTRQLIEDLTPYIGKTGPAR